MSNISDNAFADLESDDENVRRAAIFTVAKSDAVAAIARLTDMAGRDPSIEIRYLCRKALNAIATQVRPTTNSGQATNSELSAYALASGPSELIAIRLASSVPSVRSAAYRAATLKQDKALLGALLTHVSPRQEPDPVLRTLLIRTIASLGGLEQIPALAGFLDDPDARCRATAIDVLAATRDVRAYGHIGKGLADPDHRVQTAAITALQVIGALDAVPVAARMLKSENYWTRDAGAHLLAANVTEAAIPLLEAAIDDVYEPVRIKAKLGLKRLVERGVVAAQPALDRCHSVKDVEGAQDFLCLERQLVRHPAELLSSAELEERRRAARQLARAVLLDDGSIPLITERAKIEADPETLASLMSALGRTLRPSVFGTLAEKVDHPDARVRAAVVDACAELRTEEALNLAATRLKDASCTVIGQAILALRQRSDMDLTPSIRELSHHAEPEFRKTAIRVIGILGLGRYAEFLDVLKADRVPEVAELAQETKKMLILPSRSVSRASESEGDRRSADGGSVGSAGRASQTERQPLRRRELLSPLSRSNPGLVFQRRRYELNPRAVHLLAVPVYLGYAALGPIGWLIILTSAWAYYDARSFGLHLHRFPGWGILGPAGWLAACLIVWFVAFPLYLLNRSEMQRMVSALAAYASYGEKAVRSSVASDPRNRGTVILTAASLTLLVIVCTEGLHRLLDVGNSARPVSAASVANNDGPVIIDALVVVKEYDADEVEADKKYKGRDFALSGKVLSVGTDLLDGDYVVVGSERWLHTIRCFLERGVGRSAEIVPGMKVVIQGHCEGIVPEVRMTGCSVIRAVPGSSVAPSPRSMASAVATPR